MKKVNVNPECAKLQTLPKSWPMTRQTNKQTKNPKTATELIERTDLDNIEQTEGTTVNSDYAKNKFVLIISFSTLEKKAKC